MITLYTCTAEKVNLYYVEFITCYERTNTAASTADGITKFHYSCETLTWRDDSAGTGRITTGRNKPPQTGTQTTKAVTSPSCQRGEGIAAL